MIKVVSESILFEIFPLLSYWWYVNNSDFTGRFIVSGGSINLAVICAVMLKYGFMNDSPNLTALPHRL